MCKKIICVLIAIIFCISMIGCGSSKVIDGKECETYGIFNKEEVRKPDIHYKLIVGNVIWGIILCETIVAPVYFFGFSLYEPVSKIEKEKK